MTRMIPASLVLVGLFLSSPALAHHAASSLGMVRLGQAVMVGDTMLQPGTYEIRLTGEHLPPNPGQSEDGVQMVEFIANGQTMARYGAEVMPADPNVPVGTSGGEATRARVDMLRGGEFLRVSMNKGSERFLIHLPLAGR